MELLVAPVEHITFDIEVFFQQIFVNWILTIVSIHVLCQVALSQQLGAQPLPFPGMDKSGAAVCEFYVRRYSATGI